jgi:1-deoxy-D-xylulose-5-phosphate synthase
MLTDWRCPLEAIPVGKGRLLRQGDDVALLTIGPIGKSMAGVIDEAAAHGVSVAHYDMRFLKPIDEDLLSEVGRLFSHVITVEDGAKKGGLGSAVLEYLTEQGLMDGKRVDCLGIPDEFIEHGTVKELREIVGINAETIAETILS